MKIMQFCLSKIFDLQCEVQIRTVDLLKKGRFRPKWVGFIKKWFSENCYSSNKVFSYFTLTFDLELKALENGENAGIMPVFRHITVPNPYYSCNPIIAKGFWQRPARKLGNYREIPDFTLSREYAWRKFLSENLALWLIIYECGADAASSQNFWPRK